MRICLNCGELIKDDKLTSCPHCTSSELKEELNEEEAHKISKAQHKEDTRMYDREQNALCFVVLGSISLIVSILFFILSFTKKRNVRHFNPGSMQFVMCVITLAVGVGALGYGLYRFLTALKVRKRCHRIINSLKTFRKDEAVLH